MHLHQGPVVPFDQLRQIQNIQSNDPGFVFLSASIVVNVSDLVFFSNPSEINGNAEKHKNCHKLFKVLFYSGRFGSVMPIRHRKSFFTQAVALMNT